MLTEQGQQARQAYSTRLRTRGRAAGALSRVRDGRSSSQCISTESPADGDLTDAFAGISIDEQLFEMIGPAVNSVAGTFLYGHPGNGKSTLAKCITACFGQAVWIPRVIVEDSQLVKLFDASCHRVLAEDDKGILKAGSTTAAGCGRSRVPPSASAVS